MNLKDLLDEELYGQVEAKITEHNSGIEDKLQHIRYADLSEGNYVSKDKYTAMETKMNGLQEQLNEANKTIDSYKDMDVEGIKQSVKDWKEKYETDTADLQARLDNQAKEFATKEYMSKFQFTSALAKNAALSEFMAQGFKMDENGKFLGADDFMENMKKQNPGAFVVEQPAPIEDPTPAVHKPNFAPPQPATPPKSRKKMSLTEMMKFVKENPETNVKTLFEE